MPWIVRKLRGTPVYVKARPDGTPAAEADGRVDILYRLDPAAKVYRAAVRNLEPTGDPADDRPVDMEASDPIVVYTDGACTGNPGPAGLGVVIRDGDDRRELSEYLGDATNNIAELTAILRALETLADTAGATDRPVHLHTDSSYSIGVLTKNWKAKANQELIARIKRVAQAFRHLQFVKVKGHAGVPDNERADELARAAIDRRR